MSDTTESTGVAESDWPITNCYVDAWTLILADWGLEPLAALGVTIAQDYECDQFTFFKYHHDDIEELYGVVSGELTIYHSLEEQISEQIGGGRLVLAEADGYYLPDTRATSYRTEHTKTTIGIDSIDVSRGCLSYFHNVGHYELTGADYAGVFRKLPQQTEADGVLPPYIEFVKRRFMPLNGAALTEAAVGRLRHHLHRVPAANPILSYRQDFPRHMQRLLAYPLSFHRYAFGIFRQLGANFQLLARHLDWLQARGLSDLQQAREAAAIISRTAKALQFKSARIASRGRFDACSSMFDMLEQSYVTVIEELQRGLG
jgi:hypothetical protein